MTNADLPITTRHLAQQAPSKLRDEHLIASAVGILAARYSVDVRTARKHLESSAERSGVPVSVLARIVVDLGKSED